MTPNHEAHAPTTSYSKLFISHANPEDNYFASWLATKLNLLGYNVWCDTEELKGGEDFWKDIEQTIRSKAFKVLFVASKTSIEKPGTLKELAVADKIRDRGDFIIPIRLDNVPYGSFPSEMIRLTAIDFSVSWASGLQQLAEKLEKDGVPRKLSFELDQIKAWWRSSSTSQNSSLVARDEAYWCNWFPCTLPSYIYAHKFSDARASLASFSYPLVRQSDWLITFACAECLGNLVDITHTEQIELKDFLATKTYEVTARNLTISNTNYKVIELTNTAFHQYGIQQGLHPYELSHGIALYFSSAVRNSITTSRVKLDRYGLTHVSLIGDSGSYQWHYGIQGRAFLYPQSTIGISHHIVFTENGLAIGSKDQHKLRRKLGSGWYNKQWRDRLLAAMLLLAENPEDTHITIPVCCSQSLSVAIAPIQFVSPVGYIDPA